MTENVIDLDAVQPEQSLTVKVFDTLYAVRSKLDIPLTELDELQGLDKEFPGKPWPEQFRMAKRVIQIVVPDLSSDVIAKLSGRKLLHLMGTLIGAVPPAEKTTA